MNKSLVALFLIAIVAVVACTDPTAIGVGLVEDETLTIRYVDTIEATTQTVLGDPVLTHTLTIVDQLESHLMGEMYDDIFGKSSASIYSQLRLTTLIDYENTILDSIVLVLPYDTTNYYGEIPSTFGLEVLEIEDDLDYLEDYYSDKEFVVNPTLLGSIEQTIDPFAEVTVYDYATDSTTAFPHLRIPLSTDLGNSLMTLDSNFYETDTAFWRAFNGIYIRPTITGEGLVAFNLNDSRAGINLYYSSVDASTGEVTDSDVYRYQFSDVAVRMVNFKHDYSNSLVETYLQDSSKDSLMFVQGMAGVNSILTIPQATLDNLSEKIINYATLELTVADGYVDEPMQQLLLYSEAGDIDDLIKDLSIILGTNTRQEATLVASFGGDLIDLDDTGRQGYRLNISAHLQDMIDGKVDNELLLRAYFKPENPEQVVLMGSNSSYPPKLTIAYTDY